MKKAFLIGLLLAGIVPAASAAMSTGLIETTFSGSASRIDGDFADTTEISVNAQLGYFVTDAISVTGSLQFIYVELDEFNDDATWILGVGADYHFNTDADLVPYVGGEIGYADSDSALFEESFAWEVHGGIKQFVASNVAIVWEAFYGQIDDIDNLGVTFGLSFFFGPADE